MKKVLRVFLKGEPRSWLDFEMPEGATFVGMIGQAKFEGWIINQDRMVSYDAIAGAVEIQFPASAPLHFGSIVGHA